MVELYGGEGTGKTESCLHLAARCILPEEWNSINLGGKDAGVIFIDNDYNFSTIRLATLMERYIIFKAKECSKDVCVEAVEKFIKLCLKKFHLVQCTDSNQFLMTLHKLENLILNEPGISAIFIDSLSAFYWLDRYNGGESVANQEANLKMSVATLSKLVNMYNLVLVVTKAAVFKKKGTQNDLDEVPDADNLEAEHSEFLCKPWQRMVTNRLVFFKVPESNSPQVYMVGGDSMPGLKKFIVTEYGLQFEP